MKISYIALLSISLSYGLERPISDETLKTQPQVAPLDLSKVKPLQIEESKEQERDTPADQAEERNPVIEQQKPALAVNKTWLGVSGEAPSETLRAHLGLQAGLVLRLVASNSPAALGGLQEHDIITKVNDDIVKDQNTLKALIQSYAPDEVVNIHTISKGEGVTRQVTLASRPAQNSSQIPNHYQDRSYREGVRDQEQRSEQSLREPRRSRGLGGILKDMGFNKLLKEADPSNNFNIDFKSTSTIMIHDSEGSVEVQALNGERHVIVRGKNGEVQYEGPWNTEQEKANTTQEIRKRVENIAFNYKNHNLKFGSHSTEEIR